ncbi:vWA domain-containing protein [Pseudorhodobacter ferrugineus]|uniref:vWA domain-containing protein n=1 Tax=Pseudorhodobacter ferrugineus TaxID=77008 RepID=UPI0003B72201|nr:VWA domain-containing protein [Pseudorhodobacter ferrugineus]
MRGLGSILSFLLMCAGSLAAADGKSIIVLDGSGSMWGQIDGRPKLEIAREALAGVLTGLPATTELGLMAYGHREKGNCGDIELMVAPAAGTGPAITAAANKMQFLGKTPLTEAVRRAAAELRSTEEKATVILITDGIETCEADPCALGAELEASGVDFTAHVVGFGLTADEGKTVACLAENTGGKYIEAKDAGSLTQALQTAVAVEPTPAPAPEPVKPAVLDKNLTAGSFWVEGGDLMTEEDSASIEVYNTKPDGTRGDLARQQYSIAPMLIDPGTYILVVDRDEAEAEMPITVTADQMTVANVVLNAAKLTINPLTEAGGTPNDRAAVDIVSSAGKSSSHYGVSTRVLPAGTYTVNVRIGQANASTEVVMEAGKHQTVDVIVATGLAVLNTYYTPDTVMDDIGQGIDVYEAKQALDGSRKSVVGSYGSAQEFTLPPGDYVAVGRKDSAKGEIAFTVKPNERVEVAIQLNAGVLSVSAPNARGIELFSAKKDIQGNRKSVRYDYGDTMQSTMTAGDYVIEAEIDGAKIEALATVTAGERTEITLP